MSSRQHPPALEIPNIIIYFICRIESSFPDERTSFVKTFCQHFMNRVDKYAEKQETENEDRQEEEDDEENENENDQEKQNDKYYTDNDIYNRINNDKFELILSTFIPYIIYNRFMCPFKDINESFYKLIKHINTKLNMSIPEMESPYPLSGYLQSTLKRIELPYQKSNLYLYNNLYKRFGRISHFELLLLSHNKYFESYLSDFNNLFYSLMYDNNSALTLSKREYFGLMACSRYSCHHIIKQCEQRYIKLNGDLTWIKSGINCAPNKYLKLTTINALLAHQPWKIESSHIKELLECKSNPWTISQIIQIFIILIMYHFLCGMYYGLCITPEIDQYYISLINKHSHRDIKLLNKILQQQPKCYKLDKNSCVKNENENKNKNIIQLLSKCCSNNNNKIENKIKSFEQSAIINDDSENECDDSLSMEFDPNLAPTNINIKEEKKEEKEEKKEDKNKNKTKKKIIIPPESGGIIYWKYSLNINMIYNDFDCHNDNIIHAYDFNWDKHGYALISKYYPGIEKKMDSVFKTAYNMTDNSMGSSNNLDTEPFRIAVWHYVYRLYGVNNDSYEYSEINKMLPIKLKIFIKKLVCYPQIIEPNDFKNMGFGILKEKEKIHIAILALTAKYQASLLFGLRAIMKYIQSN